MQPDTCWEVFLTMAYLIMPPDAYAVALVIVCALWFFSWLMDRIFSN